MNGDDAHDPRTCQQDIAELDSTAPRIVLHRLTEVRRAMGVPRQVLAQRLGITVQELRVKEESPDLSIGTLCQWAAVLNVPITELVVERDECLAPIHLAESQANRLMKMAAKLRDRARRRSIQRLAQTFVEQLAEILPELEHFARTNHSRLRRRTRPPLGRPTRPVSERILRKPPGPDEG